MKWAYYNDNEPYVAEWTRNLMKAGVISQGVVDERPIQEIQPEELREFHRVHFFSGICGWELALNLAEYEGKVWTGSCPCQPFSGAGRRKGEADKRHVWPEFLRLIATCKPEVVFGEQVAGSMGSEWMSGVRFDFENIIYWEQFYKNLHRLQSCKTIESLSEVCGEIAGWVETSLCEVPEGIRSEMEEEQQGEATESSPQETNAGKDLHAKIQRGGLGKIHGVKDSTQMSEEGDSVQLGRTSDGDKREVFERDMRTNRTASKKRPRRKADVEQRLAGSDKPDGWIRVLEHSNSLFRNECGIGRLGGEGIRDDCLFIFKKEDLNDQQRITAKFRTVIAQSVARLERHNAIQSDLGQLGYACGIANLPASCAGEEVTVIRDDASCLTCSKHWDECECVFPGPFDNYETTIAGAVHVRQRLFWVAYSESNGRLEKQQESRRSGKRSREKFLGERLIDSRVFDVRVAYPDKPASERGTRGLSEKEDGVGSTGKQDGDMPVGYTDGSESDRVADSGRIEEGTAQTRESAGEPERPEEADVHDSGRSENSGMGNGASKGRKKSQERQGRKSGTATPVGVADSVSETSGGHRPRDIHGSEVQSEEEVSDRPSGSDEGDRVADPLRSGTRRRPQSGDRTQEEDGGEVGDSPRAVSASGGGGKGSDGVGNTDETRSQGSPERQEGATGDGSVSVGVADSGSESAQDELPQDSEASLGEDGETPDGLGRYGGIGHEGWGGIIFIPCLDGKARPIEPRILPLADGLPLGLGNLSPEQRELAEMAGLDGGTLKGAKNYRIKTIQGYGNAIVPQVAAEFIMAFMEAEK